MSDPFKLRSSNLSHESTQEVQPSSIDFLPHDVIQAIRDPSDWQRRTGALENLKGILEGVTDISALMSNSSSFVTFLVSLLDDSHFRVIHTTLQIIEMLAERFGDKIENDIIETTDFILHRITENKNSLYAREKMPKFFLKLMHLLSPHTIMMRLVTSSLHSKSHKIREDTLFLIMAGLLTFPRTEFDLGSIAEHVVPLIADSRQRVRYIALEAISVVAHSLEPGLLKDTHSNYMQPLLSPVQRWEAENMSEGILLRVIQARLSRKKLPHINSDGTVEPAVPFPTNASRQDNGMDIEWIISSTIERTQGDENEVSTNGSRLLPVQPPRRFSAGRQKLPWEKERKEQSLSAPTRKEDGSYQMNFLQRQQENQIKPPPPTYSNWLAESNQSKNLSRSDRFYPRTLESANNSPKQTRLGYMDQYMGNRRKRSEPINREELFFGESDFVNEVVYPTGAEADLSQSWPAQLFEKSQPLPSTDTGDGISTTSQFPFKLAKARPCSKQQPSNSKPERRANDSVLASGKASIHLPAIEREPVEKPSETQSEVKQGKKRERRAFSSKPKENVTPVSDEISKVASSCCLGPSKKAGTNSELMYSLDVGHVAKTSSTLPRPKRPLMSDKPLVKTKPRSNTLPNPAPASNIPVVDNSDSHNISNNNNNSESNERLEEPTNVNQLEMKEQIVATRQDEPISPPPSQTWTSDLAAIDPSPEQLRGNQVAHLSEEEPNLIVKPPRAKPVRVSSKTRLRRTFIGPISDRADYAMDTSLPSSLAVDISTTSLQDSLTDLSPKQQGEKSHSLPRLPSDTAASYSPEPQEVLDRGEEDEATPTPGDPITCNSNNVTPVVSNKPSPDLEENISEEIYYKHGEYSDQKKEIQSEAPLKQHNPTIKPPIPARPQQKESSSYFGIYHKKKTIETDTSSTNSSSSNLQKFDVEQILPSKTESKKRQSYDNVFLNNNNNNNNNNNGANSNRPVRRRVDLTRSLNHSTDEELEDLSVLNDTSESVFSLSPSFGRYQRGSAGSGSMDTSALSQLSISPQELKKNSPITTPPVKNETESYKHSKALNNTSVHNSPYEMNGTSPMDCSPIDKLTRSPSHPTNGGTSRVYTKGFSPSKGMKLTTKKSPTHNKPAPPADLSIRPKDTISVVGVSPSAIYSSPKYSILPASPTRSKAPPLKDIKPSLDTVQLEEGCDNPLLHPEASLVDALCYFEDESWECKIEGLTLIKRLAKHHTDTLLVQIKQVTYAVIAEVKNLRSTVSKAAILTFCELFVYLNRMLEPHLDLIIKTLLHKAGESNTFIREDIEKSLCVVLHNISVSKAFTALINGGIGHKSSVVRKLTMQVIYNGIEQIGYVQVLNLPRDVLEKLMTSITSTSQDNTPDARYYARKALTVLVDNPDFYKKINKSLNPDLLAKVMDLVKLVQTKGVGELPTAGLQSARQSRIGQAPTRQNPHSADTRVDTTDSVKNSYALRQGVKSFSGNSTKPRKNSLNQEFHNVTILPEDIHTRLDSNKWFERLEAIKEIHELVIQHPNIAHDQRIVKAIEAYILRLTDSNSKVNTLAIECFLDLITVLGNKLVQHLHPIFKALTSNLASKNQIMKNKAKESLENILKSIDNMYLVQPLSSVAQYANNLVRPVLLNTLADVSATLFDNKPGVVQKYVLPLIFSLLEHHLNAECSAALQNLCQVVYQHMNNSLFEKASRLSNSQQEKLRKLTS